MLRKVYIAILGRCILPCLFGILLAGIEAKQVCAQPLASFTASPASGCSPLVVKFINKSSGAVSYDWDLGNGNKSTLKDPSAIYHIPGYYTIILKATDAGGLQSTHQLRVRVFRNPGASFALANRSICAGAPAQFRSTSSPGDTAISIYSWDFGDGILGNGQNPVHSYTQSGSYKVSLFIQDLNGCKSDTIISDYAAVLSKPIAALSFNQRSFCSAPASVLFSNKSTGSTSYIWNFGDGQTSTDIHPKHTYQSYGTYRPELIARASNGCTDTALADEFVDVKPLQAGFRIKESPCGPGTFTFISEASAYNGLTYSWDFGGGKSSALEQPSVYLTPGTYTVKLTVYNSTCFANAEQQIVIKPKPSGSISYEPKPVCGTPAEVRLKFEGSSPATYQWKMNGDYAGNEAEIKRKLDTDASVQIALEVNLDGCSAFFHDSLSISSPQVDIVPVDGGCIPRPVQFQCNANSKHPIVKYSWDFGGKGQSNLKNPSFTFIDTGSFQIGLTITDALGCTAAAAIPAMAGIPVKPKLDYDTSAICNGETKTFKNISTEKPVPPHSYTWIIAGEPVKRDNGDVSRKIRRPPGFKEVSLISNHYGCLDTFTHPLKFYVKAPFSDLRIAGDSCGPATVTVYNSSLGATHFDWFNKPFDAFETDTFQILLEPGLYEAFVATYNDQTGCRDTASFEYRMYPAPELDLQSSGNLNCPPVRLQLKVSTAYTRKISIEANGFSSDYSHLLPEFNLELGDLPSQFDLKIIASNYNGCMRTEQRSFSGAGPRAKGKVSWSGTCLPLDLTLTDSSFGKDAYTHYWIIGNNAPIPVSADVMKLQAFERIPGKDSLPVKLMVVNDSCQDISSFNVPAPGLDLRMEQVTDVQCNSIAFGLSVIHTPPQTDLQYQWGLNDQWKAFTPDSRTTYLRQLNGKPDTAQVRVRQANGCITMLTHFLHKPDPRIEAVFRADTTGSPCPPLYVQFTDSSYSQGRNIVSWFWDLGDGTYSTLRNPGKMYLLPGKYSVSLNVTDNKGCRAVTNYPDLITIEGPEVVKTVGPLSGCIPLKVDFSGRSNEAVRYRWDLGDGNIGEGNTLTHVYEMPGTYIPLLTVSDSFGCSYTLPRTDTIRVVAFPHASFAANGNCAGDSSIFQFSGFGNGSRVKEVTWDFGDGHRDTGMRVSHVYAHGGHYNLGMEVVTEGGCRDSVGRPIRIYGARPDFRTSRPGFCLNDTIQLIHQSRADTAIDYWTWQIADSFYGRQADPFIFRFPKSGVFPIVLNLHTTNGCHFTFRDSTALIIADSTPLNDAVIKRVSVIDDHRVEIKLEQEQNPFAETQTVWLSGAGNGWTKQGNFDPQDSLLFQTQLQTRFHSYCMLVQRQSFCGVSPPPDTSKMHCTIELQARGDTLRNLLNWSPYIGWPQIKHYEVYYRDNDALVLLDSLEPDQLHYTHYHSGCPDLSRYVILAKEKAGHQEYSYSDTAAARPRFGYDVPAPEIWRATVEDDRFIRLEWLIPDHGAIPIQRIQVSREGYGLILETDEQGQGDLHDMHVHVDKHSYLYLTRLQDTCGNWSPYSNIGKTVLLAVGYDREQLKPLLRWTGYREWAEGVDHYRVERLTDDGTFMQIGRSNNDLDTFFTDPVSPELCNANYCYRVTAVRQQPHTYPDSSHQTISLSNVACAAVESHLYVPNAFTLNRDNLNESFRPAGLFLKSYRMQIYNRWGEKLFETTDCFGAWDGHYLGSECEIGAYTYILEAIGADDKPYFFKGTVQLMK